MVTDKTHLNPIRRIRRKMHVILSFMYFIHCVGEVGKLWPGYFLKNNAILAIN
jgi:hypothetical protein